MWHWELHDGTHPLRVPRGTFPGGAHSPPVLSLVMCLTHFSIYLVDRPMLWVYVNRYGVLTKSFVHGFGRILHGGHIWCFDIVFDALASYLEPGLRTMALHLKLLAS